MIKTRLTTVIFITGCFCLVFSGCQEQTNNIQKPETIETISEMPSEEQIESQELTSIIQFEKTDIDLGEITPGSVSNVELKFKNSGQGILIIPTIEQCCGVVAETDKQEYAPGESGILKINYQDRGFTGTIEKEIIVYNNDPENPEFPITIKASVVQVVFWEPEKIKLFLNEDNAACPKIKINCTDNQVFAITGFRSTGDCITADYNPAEKKTEFILDLKVNMEKLPENTKGEIEIRMNHPGGNYATISFDVLKKFGLSPASLYLYNLKENETKETKVKILNNYEEDFEIESTSSKEKTIKMVDYNKIEGGYELILEVTPPPVEDEWRFIDEFYINIKGEEQLVLTCLEYYET